ncbi:sigma-70 family RNA polymerase sigma factor [Streptomyces sp. LP05-1]|uniref:Sigma-70 family RNA polymerase sigma factor n=1 Tax=Streptomyces pyxinae TaxID=2970734 RepID=A0ABT2CNS2_9ACTN|nr:sigma-70 family RNA polymerase sigma factor [Streptomyces sp. LP05-1]MCS0638901.1 sigma-70 family RNA polymerase sigma factor [Streptomyces sp. LP05-1]
MSDDDRDEAAGTGRTRGRHRALPDDRSGHAPAAGTDTGARGHRRGADGLSGQVPKQGQRGGAPGAAAWAAGSAPDGVPGAFAEEAPVADGAAGAGPEEAPEAPVGAAGEAVEPGGWNVPPQRASGSAPGSVLPPPLDLPPSDADLVRRMRDGDDGAYGELYRRHSGAVRRYARSCCRDDHTAEDLTAEVFARALQAVRGGTGPRHAVRPYLLTTVRHVAAAWTRTARRERLVEDFAVFAAEAMRTAEVPGDDTVELGAEVRAMHEAEQSLAMRAFRSLPERWQAVLWHTTVEEESPSEVAPLFGLTANATSVLASRAREGLKQAYLQAHVSESLTSGGDCARYADRLGAYARGGLRTRAERGLRKHLEECSRCRLAVGELEYVNSGIPAVVPVAVIGWFAAGFTLKATGALAGGTVVGGAAGAVAGALSGGGAGAGAGAGAGVGAGGSGAAGGTAEGLGAPVKAGLAAAAAVAATAGLVWALAGDPGTGPETAARPPATRPVVPPPAPEPVRPSPSASAPTPERTLAPPPAPVEPAPAEPAPPRPSAAAPSPEPSPSERAPAPGPKPTPRPERPPAPTPRPTPRPTPPPSSKPPTPPAVYQVAELPYSLLGDHTAPEIRFDGSSPLWQRRGLSIAGTRYAHGATVHAPSSVLIDLNRPCVAYEALAGVDDLGPALGAVRFSVFGGDGGGGGDGGEGAGGGERLWRSPVLRAGDTPVPVRVDLTGQRTIRLVVEAVGPLGSVPPADWAQSRISCG